MSMMFFFEAMQIFVVEKSHFPRGNLSKTFQTEIFGSKMILHRFICKRKCRYGTAFASFRSDVGDGATKGRATLARVYVLQHLYNMISHFMVDTEHTTLYSNVFLYLRISSNGSCTQIFNFILIFYQCQCQFYLHMIFTVLSVRTLCFLFTIKWGAERSQRKTNKLESGLEQTKKKYTTSNKKRECCRRI